MHHLVRISFSISSIFLIVLLTGCGAAKYQQLGDNSGPKPLITPQAQSGRPKIIALGDSLTAGFGLAEKESYPYLLQQRLNADGHDYEVINAGVSGDTSLGGLERADWVLEQDNAEILILELGANDLLRGLPPTKMKENLDQIIRKARAKNVEVLLCGMLAPPTVGADYQREYMMAFPDLAREHDVTFLPFLLEGVALKKELNQPDGIHPNAEGEKVMTENIYKALRPMLEKMK
ncbi:MAG: arylesterase [Pyrinomonadaceae bacterium]